MLTATVDHVEAATTSSKLTIGTGEVGNSSDRLRLNAKENGCDANVQPEPKRGKQEKPAEHDKMMFHGHLLKRPLWPSL